MFLRMNGVFLVLETLTVDADHEVTNAHQKRHSLTSSSTKGTCRISVYGSGTHTCTGMDPGEPSHSSRVWGGMPPWEIFISESPLPAFWWHLEIVYSTVTDEDFCLLFQYLGVLLAKLWAPTGNWHLNALSGS